MALLPTPARRRWFAVLIALLVLVPWVVGHRTVDVLNSAAIAAMVALPLNLLTGVAGQLSLGPAAVLAVGAYTTGILSHTFGMPLAVSLLASLAAGALTGLLVGLPSMRLRGLYLVLSTLALHFIVVTAGGEYQFRARLNTGIPLPAPGIGDWRLVEVSHWYYVLVAAVLLIGLLVANLKRSRAGRAWMAIRDRDVAASSLGVSLVGSKLAVWIVTSALMSVAGTFYAYYVRVVNVEAFSLFLAIQFVAMIIIGGLGTVTGSIMGALFVTIVLEFAESWTGYLPLPSVMERNIFSLNFMVFGLLMIVFLLAEPRGLVAIWTRFRDWVVLWPFRYRPLRRR